MSEFSEIIRKMLAEYGEEVFRNAQRANAILMDFAVDNPRNRLLARHFIESGGYDALKNNSVTLAVRRLREDFSIEANAAAWITSVFAEVMGVSHQDLQFKELSNFSSFSNRKTSSASVALGMSHTVAVLQDGTAIAAGENDFLQCDVGDWRNVVSIAAGNAHTVALLDLPTANNVLATGRNTFDQCDVARMANISSIYAFDDDTVCVDVDGAAFSVGKSGFDLSHFKNIKSIAKHPEGVYGLRHDGSVATSAAGWEEEEWANSLTDVVQIISTYVNGSIVLKNNGKIYKMGYPDSYFAAINDVVSIVDLSDGFAILRKDGTVRILPYDRSTPRKITAADNWSNVSAIYGKYKRLIALTEESRLLSVCTDPEWLRRSKADNLDFLDDWFPVLIAGG